MFADDEYPRHGATLEAMKGLKPAFDKNGTVTAGNASGSTTAPPPSFCFLQEGQGAGLKPLRASRRSLRPASIRSTWAWARAGVEAHAARAGWEPKDLDLMEINEAFAAQAIAVNRQMGWDTKKVNVNGGAIALGHPIGASGCRILVTLLTRCRSAMQGAALRRSA